MKKKKVKMYIHRITGVLYIGIIAIPLMFFVVFSQINQLESGTQVIRELGRSGGEMLSLPQITNSEERKRIVENVDRKMASVKEWFVHNNDSLFYVGSKTPLKDYGELAFCWDGLKKAPSPGHALRCWKKAKSLTFAVERTVALQMERLKNILYLTVAGTMLLLLLLVVFVRAYMHQQAKKLAIRDEETGLHNRKYCREVLESLLAQASRRHHPLSALYMKIERFEDYSEEQREGVLRALGSFLNNETRESDVACRIEENGFAVWLPETTKEGAKVFEKRLREGAEAELGKVFEGFTLRMEITESEKDDDVESFLARVLSR
ncbi:GGDEF domain-containing protein [Nitratifractor sp.]